MLHAPDPLQVLWLCGPAGVGKTTVGWELFSRLTASGLPAGYVDIDHLGIFLPGPPEDPELHRMKTRNLAAVLANFREGGARCVVVSGVVDPVQGVYADELPRTHLTVCRLRADRAELAQRFTGRGMQTHRVQETLDEADVMDVSGFGDVCIDTTGLKVAEVVRQVTEHIGDRTGPGRRLAEPSAGDSSAPLLPGRPSRSTDRAASSPKSRTPAVGARVLWLFGPTGVGKSTIGWQVYQRIRGSARTAYVELDQLAFLRPAQPEDLANHRLTARNLAALWHAYSDAGAEVLIVNGSVEDEAAVRLYTAALPEAAITMCRLHASRTALTERIKFRGQGGSWPAPGDPLKGRPTAELLRIADEAAATAGALERAALGHLRIDTDDRTVEESAAAITAAWPAR
ncbi:AAA family ATPase [Peterkaempfera sp. SMS 1(5)a]|uniref:AAA family ATPase n=1 Tax=Peterkaempfera podocarpi TaxID=3232308 RepID=UPI00366C02A1